jgi:hypothetical protein
VFWDIVDAIGFYALPESWHGVYMLGRGPMDDDWTIDYDDDQYPDGKPGALARAVWRKMAAEGLFLVDEPVPPLPSTGEQP